MNRNAVRRLLPVLAVGLVAMLGFAIWSSTVKPRTQSPAPTGLNSAPPAAADVANQVRKITAHGSRDGYVVAAEVTRTDVGSSTLTALDIRLSTEDTPASAPTAEAELVGVDHKSHNVALIIIGPGHWTSHQFAIPAGRYTLTSRFHRGGGPVSIPVTIVLT